MKKFSGWFWLILSFSSLSCGGPQEASSRLNPLPEVLKVPTSLDLSGLNKEQQKDIESILQLAKDLPLEIPEDATIAKYFSRIFGLKGERIDDFVLERIHFLASQESSTPQARTVPTLGPPLLADNKSLSLWINSRLQSTQESPLRIPVSIRWKSFDVRSTRIGIVELAKGFFGLTRFEKLSVLVHEARHSDCAAPLDREDMNRFIQNLLPLRNKNCGYVHVYCQNLPIAACDDVAWGSYGIQLLLARAVVNYCPKCDSSTKQAAQKVIEVIEPRILLDFDQQLSGKYGDPDLSSI